jgi:hypothetical protein
MVRRALLGIGVVALLVVGAVVSVKKSAPSELRVYVVGAERMMAGEPVYRVGEPKPFTYPPFFALPFVPFTWLPEPLHKPVFFLANALMVAVVLRRLALRARPPGETWPRRGVFWAGVAAVSVWHVNTVFEKQTHDDIVLLLLVLAIDALCAGHEGRAGVLGGLAAACKATPLALVGLLVWQRRWRATLWFVLVATLCTLLPDALLPSRDGVSWVSSWHRAFVAGVRPGESAVTPGEWTPWNMLNQNLAGTLYRLGTPVARAAETNDQFDVSLWTVPAGLLRALTVAAQLAVVGWTALVCWPGRGRADNEYDQRLRRLGEGGVVLCAMVLLSPWSSKTHFGVLVVAAVFCAAWLLYRRVDKVAVALLAVAAVLGLLTAKDLWGRPLVNELLARGSVTWCAVLSMVAAGRLLLRPVPRSD